MDVNIREVRGEDSLEYRELHARGLADHPEAFGETSEHFAAKSPAIIAAQLEARRADGGFTLGAFVGDQLIGTVALIPDKGEKFRHRGMLIGMYVHPDFRGQSISARLIDELLTRGCRLEGLERTTKLCRKENALRFLECVNNCTVERAEPHKRNAFARYTARGSAVFHRFQLPQPRRSHPRARDWVGEINGRERVLLGGLLRAL